jgi:nucleotide sugar dehydrogenase
MFSTNKIGIIGGGFVGSATRLFESENNEVIVYDIDPTKCYKKEGGSVSLREICEWSEVIFICLPTPMNKDGSCSTRLLDKVIEDIKNIGTSAYIVVRSTVPVGYCKSKEVNFMPEFLTEANWKEDFMNCEEWVVGVNIDEKNEESFIKKMIDVIRLSNVKNNEKFNFVTTDEGEMIKYVRNCFLATKVSFYNEIYSFCKAKCVDYNRVIELVVSDKRIGKSHSSVPGPDGHFGYGGTCFPKDMASLEYQMKSADVHPYIIEAANKRNNEVDRKEKDWSNDKGRAVV